MAIVTTDNKYYAEIAAAIREKLGTTARYTPAQMAEAILSISGGTGLPDGYVLLNYLQSGGAQYINTGFKPNNNTRIVVDFQSTGAASDNIKALFGSRTSYNAGCFNLWIMPQTVYPQYGANEYTAKPISKNVSSRMVYDMNKNVATVGNTSVTFASTTFATNYPVYLFNMNDGGIPDDRPAMGRLYSCQIYDNGTLVRDYAPCINPSGAFGLYDKVSGQFYGNAGSGAFTGG